MRDIKFRFWLQDDLEMVSDLSADTEDVNDIFSYLEQENITAMQFTGLKDKNGVDIYEGDIVTGSYHNLRVDYSKKGAVQMGYTHDSDGWTNSETYG